MAQTIIVDISTRGANPVAYTHQGDTGRTFFAEIYENGEAFAVAGYTIKVGAILPADRGYTVIAGNDMVTATKTNDNTTNKIYFTLSDKYSLKAGNGILTLIFTSNTGTPSTIRPINIDLRIQKSADADDTIAGASDFPEGLEAIAEEVFQEYLSTYLPPVAPSASAAANKAADAKLTGEALDDLKSDLSKSINIAFTKDAYNKRITGGEVLTNASIYKISNPIKINRSLFNVITVEIAHTQIYANEVTFINTNDIENLSDDNIISYYRTGSQALTNQTVKIPIPFNASYVVFTTYGNPDVKVVTSARFDRDDVFNTISDSFNEIRNNPDNIFYGTFTDGYYLGVDGTATGNASYCYCNEYIPVVRGQYVSNRYIRFITMYDANKNVVSSAGITTEIVARTPFTIPNNIAYIRPTFLTEAIASYVSINRGNELTDNITQRGRVDKSATSYKAIKTQLGTSGCSVESTNGLVANTYLLIEDFPQYIKSAVSMSVMAKFDSFDSIKFGLGTNNTLAGFVQIDSENITYHVIDANEATLKTVAHGLTISSYLSATFRRANDGNMTVAINTLTGTFQTTFSVGYYYMMGAPFIRSTSNLTYVKISAESESIKKPIWIIGDSYMSVDDERVAGQLKNLGYFDSVMITARSGLDSENAFAEFEKLISLGCPKILVWYITMNDSDATYRNYVKQVSQICNTYDIDLILNKAPSIPSLDNTAKNSFISRIGRRFVDSASAVHGGNTSGTWYNGFLSSDNIHPSELGAKALAMQILVDVPEILQS